MVSKDVYLPWHRGETIEVKTEGSLDIIDFSSASLVAWVCPAHLFPVLTGEGVLEVYPRRQNACFGPSSSLR